VRGFAAPPQIDLLINSGDKDGKFERPPFARLTVD
jgi:hypothetical protein